MQLQVLRLTSILKLEKMAYLNCGLVYETHVMWSINLTGKDGIQEHQKLKPRIVRELEAIGSYTFASVYFWRQFIHSFY